MRTPGHCPDPPTRLGPLPHKGQPGTGPAVCKPQKAEPSGPSRSQAGSTDIWKLSVYFPVYTDALGIGNAALGMQTQVWGCRREDVPTGAGPGARLWQECRAQWPRAS